MDSLEDTVKALIAELTSVQVRGYLPENDENGFSIPGQIIAGNDLFITTSPEMERLIEVVARELKRRDGTLARTHTDQEWRWIVRGAFGPALAEIDLNDDVDQNAKAVLTTIDAGLKSPKQGSGLCERAFGCTLFGTVDVLPFDVGPVRFEPRLAWLARKVAEGDVTNTTARRVTGHWAGAKQRKRKRSVDAMRERDILDAVGHCPYVCSVKTLNLASVAGRLKAQTAANLAMTAIALRWQVPSRALDGFNLLIERGFRRQRSLAFLPGKITLAGGTSQGMPHGPSISPADWAAELTQHRADFDMAGEAIAFFLSSDGAVARPKLMNTLTQALLWFHEGCREQVTLMAVVKFSATLDALAVGGKSGGIRRLVSARLGIRESQEIRKDGPTMRAAIDEIYSEGRSRTIHGTNDKLGHDWSSTRALGEQFARLCLIAALDWAVKNPAADDPVQLQK
jgi:hypothetical protein